ncbi:PREDICTED: uncharacterized protein LOC109160501 [Ipomoea nil]|uniref:uncharacterized protein LOC109160501 n=1 Tax=Ipomoea nil TaxID=35883 RepID=UPI000901E193|nr:PREDICTED: uncharacterized protein LOC109160501 [Ipomoea nil]
MWADDDHGEGMGFGGCSRCSNERVAEMVANLPLSKYDRKDALFWVAESWGKFMVKSCYSVLAGEYTTDEWLGWTKIWTLKIPPKVKMLIWQTCNGCLPTTDILRGRRVDYTATCRLCDAEAESSLHVFFKCLMTRACWRWIGVRLEGVSVESVSMGFQFLFSTLNMNWLGFALTLCWSAWQCQNKPLWNAEAVSVDKILSLAQSFWNGWRRVHVHDEEGDCEMVNANVERWRMPVLGRCKLNVDAAFDHGSGDTGSGWVSAMVAPATVARDATSVESLGIRKALSWLKEWQLTEVDVKMDAIYAKVVIDAVQGNAGNSYFDLIIDYIRNIVDSIHGLQFCFIKRLANQVAHVLAGKSDSLTDRLVWFNVPPLFLVSVLELDNEV